MELPIQGPLLFEVSQTLLPARFGMGAPRPGGGKVALQGGLGLGYFSIVWMCHVSLSVCGYLICLNFLAIINNGTVNILV